MLFVFAVKTFVNIGYGEAGVLFKTFGNGVVTDEPPLGEGLNIVMPWNKVYIYNVKQQEVFESKMQVLSSNGLDISLDISVLYQPKIAELIITSNERIKLFKRCNYSIIKSCSSKCGRSIHP